MNTFTGSGRLLRLALRRDRFQLTLWLIGLTILLTAAAATMMNLYANDPQGRMDSVNNRAEIPVLRMLVGAASGDSVGGIVVSEMLYLIAILAALMSTFAVIRHTRQNEDYGRSEIIGSGIVGKQAPMTAALMLIVGGNIALAFLLSIGLMLVGLPLTGSIAMGIGIGGVGITFAGVAAVTSQIMPNARGANMMAAGSVIIAYGLRAIGDGLGTVTADGTTIVSAWPSWLSPIGWAQQLGPYGDERWWVLTLFPILFLLLVVIAFKLMNKRDYGGSLFHERKGPSKAPTALLGSIGLAWRQHRGTIGIWSIGMLLLGGVLGIIGVDEGVYADDQVGRAFEQLGLPTDASQVDAFMVLTSKLLGAVSAAYVVMATLRIRNEELDGPLEQVLSTPTSRFRWMMSHVTMVSVGVFALLFTGGLALGAGSGVVIGDMSEQLLRQGIAVLAQVPAALVFMSLLLLIFSFWPRWMTMLAVLGWIGATALGLGGDLFLLPEVVQALSPLYHTPLFPADPIRVLPLLLMMLIASILVGVSLLVFRQRDMS